MRIVAALGASALSPSGNVAVERAARALAPLAADHELLVCCPRRADGPCVAGPLLDMALRRRLPGCETATMVTCLIVTRDSADPARLAGTTLDPVGILGEPTVRRLLEARVTVLAFAGVDVHADLDERGLPHTVHGVADDDLAADALARSIDADALLLLTDVEGVFHDFGSPAARLIRRLATGDVVPLLTCLGSRAGGMAGKLEAARRFAETGGYSVIASLDHAERALRRDAGTRVHRPAPPGSRAVTATVALHADHS